MLAITSHNMCMGCSKHCSEGKQSRKVPTTLLSILHCFYSSCKDLIVFHGSGKSRESSKSPRNPRNPGSRDRLPDLQKIFEPKKRYKTLFNGPIRHLFKPFCTISLFARYLQPLCCICCFFPPTLITYSHHNFYLLL